MVEKNAPATEAAGMDELLAEMRRQTRLLAEMVQRLDRLERTAPPARADDMGQILHYAVGQASPIAIRSAEIR